MLERGVIMKWNEINNEKDLNDFLYTCGGFHDSCLKELRYVSGAFVDEKFAMYPVNDQRKLYIIFQQQSRNSTVIELEFSRLVELHLNPNDENYTCEILDASLFFEDGKVYWGDSDWFETKRETYDGTWLCAEKVRWRILDFGIGEKEIYEIINRL